MSSINKEKGIAGIMMRLVVMFWVFCAMTSMVGVVYISFEPLERLSKVGYVLYPALFITLAPIVLAMALGLAIYIIHGDEGA